MIISHSNWEELFCLLKQLDNENNDIYIHIDKKVKNPPIKKIKSILTKANVEVFVKYKVYWGSYELVLTELFLLEQASKKNHEYYHLLSGTDLLIKPLEEFYEFFERNKGYEFVQFDSNERLKNDKEILRRVKLYHFFVNNRKKYSVNIVNSLFTYLSRGLLLLQEFFRIDRLRKLKYDIKYGSQWFSITNDCVKYIISRKDTIHKIFYRTKCADELFIQTLVYNSPFENKLYDRTYSNSFRGNFRFIDIKNRGNGSSPYIWRLSNFEELINSGCLIARKFDLNIDKEIVLKILERTNKNG